MSWNLLRKEIRRFLIWVRGIICLRVVLLRSWKRNRLILYLLSVGVLEGIIKRILFLLLEIGECDLNEKFK